MPNGWIVLDKPLRLGSTNAVSAVKRALRTGGYPKVKVGHGGTLDPLATGVLPIALGEATKLAGRMLEASKVYEFTIAFGQETDTLDLEGVVTATSDARPTLAEIEATLPRFTGAIEQVPPAYSALKVDGKRAYDRARAGEMVVLEPRAVTVHSLSMRRPCEGRGLLAAAQTPAQAPAFAGATEDFITLIASVSKGTYVRSLARDIARALGTVGHVTHLRRTQAGPFSLEQAISLDILEEKAKARALEDILLPLRTALVDIPALALSPEQARLIRQGQVLTGIAAPDGLALATLDDMPVALVDCRSGHIAVERGFNL
jgi:tRNA pseudouridine55 synthase